MTGAWSEIREHDGELGSRFARLLYATVEAVRRFNRFPPPAGATAWTKEAIQDVAHEYLGGDTAPARIRRLVGTATSDESFERLLHKDVKNWFLMQARATDTGAALEALRHAIEQNPRINVAGTTPTTRTWALADHADQMPYSGALQPLVEAAYAVPDVRAAKWNPGSTHRQPIAEHDSLRRVIDAVLGAAGAPMSPKQLLDVTRARFPATLTGDSEEPFEDANRPTGDPSRDDEIVAEELWRDLKDDQKLVVGIVDDTVRDVMAATGLSRGSAHRAMLAASHTVTTHLQGHRNPDGVMRAIKDRSAKARASGTKPEGSASTNPEKETPDARSSD